MFNLKYGYNTRKTFRNDVFFIHKTMSRYLIFLCFRDNIITIQPLNIPTVNVYIIIVMCNSFYGLIIKLTRHLNAFMCSEILQKNILQNN